MKYLVLNGSPKGKRSVTMKVVNKFLEGIKNIEPEAEIEIVDLSTRNVLRCKSCYACYSIHKGTCILNKKDDMGELIEYFVNADRIILSTPLHFFNISSLLLNFFERTFPLIKPIYFSDAPEIEGTEDMSNKETAIISTCKVIFDKSYSAVEANMHFLTRGKYQPIFSTQPLTKNKKEEHLLDGFWDAVFAAGQDFATDGYFTLETKQKLDHSIQFISKNIDTLRFAQ